MTTRMKRPTPKSGASSVDVVMASASWTRALRTAAAVCRRAATATLATAGLKSPAEVCLLLTSDGAVRKLNAVYRGKDKPTNVLSFPSESDSGRETTPRGGSRTLGDIAIAYGVTAREAKAESKTLTAHLSHLVIHGILHLLGYDHERDDDALIMERLERKILARLGISDPYAPPGVHRSAPRGRHRLRRSVS